MKVFMLWDKGEIAAPDTVKRVISLWRSRNPNYEVVVLDGDDLEAELLGAGVSTKSLSIQAKSDILRVKLLAEHGGVWADVSLLPVVPLESWLCPLLQPAGFFAFRHCGYDRILGNWFLACDPGNQLVAGWYHALTHYFSRPRSPAAETSMFWRLRRRLGGGYLSTIRGRSNRPYPYFAAHYLFEQMVLSNSALSDAWSKVPVWPVLPTHSLQHARFNYRMSDRDFRLSVPRLLSCAPVQKLDWRYDWPLEVYSDATCAGSCGSF